MAVEGVGFFATLWGVVYLRSEDFHVSMEDDSNPARSRILVQIYMSQDALLIVGMFTVIVCNVVGRLLNLIDWNEKMKLWRDSLMNPIVQFG